MRATLQEKKGNLYTVISYTDVYGKNKKKWISTGLKSYQSRKTAREIMNQQLKDFENSFDVERQNFGRRDLSFVDKEDAKRLFSNYIQKYLDTRKNKVTKIVYYNYQNCYMNLFKNYFDKRNLRLIDITERELMDFYNHERERGIKEVTIKKYNNLLRPTLKMAFKNKLIPDNPFDYLEPIHREKVDISYYDKDEMKEFFKAIKGHPLEVPFTIAAYYGFRRSEVLGLRWRSIDFEHKLITINHKLVVVDREVILTDQLKTKSSNRTLPLIPYVEELLLRHKAEIEKNKEFFGNSYNYDYKDYVCVEPSGKIIYPDHMTKSFEELIEDKGLRKIRLHDLRHSCASNLIASGVPMKEIQEWLGHANFATTADVYSHLDYSFKVQAANCITKAYGGKNAEVLSENSNTNNQVEILKNAFSEMKKLGINNIDEYLKHITST